MDSNFEGTLTISNSFQNYSGNNLLNSTTVSNAGGSIYLQQKLGGSNYDTIAITESYSVFFLVDYSAVVFSPDVLTGGGGEDNSGIVWRRGNKCWFC